MNKFSKFLTVALLASSVSVFAMDGTDGQQQQQQQQDPQQQQLADDQQQQQSQASKYSFANLKAAMADIKNPFTIANAKAAGSSVIAKFKVAGNAVAFGTVKTAAPNAKKGAKGGILGNKMQATKFALEWTALRAVPVAAVYGAYKLYKYATAKKETKNEDLFDDLDEEVQA